MKTCRGRDGRYADDDRRMARVRRLVSIALLLTVNACTAPATTGVDSLSTSAQTANAAASGAARVTAPPPAVAQPTPTDTPLPASSSSAAPGVGLTVATAHASARLDTNRIDAPLAGSSATLPVHVLAQVAQARGEVTAVLRMQDGTQVTDILPVVRGQDGDGPGLVVGTLDAPTRMPSRPAATQSASLELRDASGTVLARTDLQLLGANDPATRLITLYWVAGEVLRPVQRRIPRTDRIGAAALDELLWGPTPSEGAGLSTDIPTPEQVFAYAGRDASWGARVTLRGLNIRDGVATADFSKELRAYGGGSMRVGIIRQQITRTLEQFPTVHEVRIAIEGQSAAVLEP
jgi:hypothetical protein